MYNNLYSRKTYIVILFLLFLFYLHFLFPFSFVFLVGFFSLCFLFKNAELWISVTFHFFVACLWSYLPTWQLIRFPKNHSCRKADIKCTTISIQEKLHRYPLPFVSLLPCLSPSLLLRLPRFKNAGLWIPVTLTVVFITLTAPLNLFNKYNTTYNTYTNYNTNNSYNTYQQIIFLLRRLCWKFRVSPCKMVVIALR